MQLSLRLNNAGKPLLLKDFQNKTSVSFNGDPAQIIGAT